MKKLSFFYRFLFYFSRLLIVMGCTTFASAGAEGLSEAQILRVAKIAKRTGTTITIVRVTTTVKVKGRSKKINKRVKREVMQFMGRKNGNWTKVAGGRDDNDYAANNAEKNFPPVSGSFRQPIPYRDGRPLETYKPIPPHRVPALDTTSTPPPILDNDLGSIPLSTDPTLPSLY